MKIKTLLLVFTLVSGAAIALAQPPEGRPRHGDRGRPAGQGPDASSAPVERYMSQLQQEDTEEYRRLSELRDQDPTAFRRELRRKASEKRGRPSSRQVRHHPLREEIAALRNAENEDDRDVAIQAIRAKITERVDRSLEERENAIREIRETLQRLEEQNEQEQARREEIIDRHLQRVLNFAREQSTEEPEPGNDTP